MQRSSLRSPVHPIFLLPLLVQCGGESTGLTSAAPGVQPPGTGDVPATTDLGLPEPADPGNGTTIPGGGDMTVPTPIPTSTTPPAMVPPPGADPIANPGDPPGMTTVPPPITVPPLDCGPDGLAYENHGPAENRVNYVILADGYTAATFDTELDEHINRYLDRRFNHESGEPYGRYRNFVNICVERVVSQSNGIGNGSTAFGGGNGGDRLARVDQNAVNAYIDANIPATLEIDWRAVVLNQDLWENTGSVLMLWSGANSEAPGAALHEGGHGFHQLADEYCASFAGTRCGNGQEGGGVGTEFREVNSTGDPDTTASKWDLWLGTIQMGLKDPTLPATGIQSAFVASRYVDSGQYRPSLNSMMNSLFCSNGVCEPDNPNHLNTSFNPVSREQMIFSIWRAVRPIDSTEPPAGAVANPGTLTVNVIDPAVVNVDWSIDGNVVATNGGGQMDLAAAGLASGAHTIVATAYDNATDDLVRLRTGECPSSVDGQFCHAPGWLNSTQTVEWTVTIP